VRTLKKKAMIQSTGEKSRRHAARRERSGTAATEGVKGTGLWGVAFVTSPPTERARVPPGGRVEDTLELWGGRAV
jgi:hypothetical protein